ncbi:MAG: hypothetical protein AAGN64_17045, partial [Bacteroidota bacterium]
VSRFVYDAYGQLLRVYAYDPDEAASTQARAVAEFEYDVAGRVMDKRMGENTDGTFATAIPYTYDAQGRLVDLGDVNGATDQPFAQHLDYRADGTIRRIDYLTPWTSSASPWTNAAGSAAWSYVFTYDWLGRLASAETDYPNDGLDPWQTQFFALRKLAYDSNGNILGLERWAPDAGDGGTQHWKDKLDYVYENGTNRLKRVIDDGRGIIADDPVYNRDYVYTHRGSARRAFGLSGPNTDPQRGAMEEEMTYNDQNLPVTQRLYDEDIDLDGTPEDLMLRYRYDAAGQRVRKQIGTLGAPCAQNQACTSDPHYAVERYLRDGMELVGTLDGDGKLLHWNLPGGLGRLEPTLKRQLPIFDPTLSAEIAVVDLTPTVTLDALAPGDHPDGSGGTLLTQPQADATAAASQDSVATILEDAVAPA